MSVNFSSYWSASEEKPCSPHYPSFLLNWCNLWTGWGWFLSTIQVVAEQQEFHSWPFRIPCHSEPLDVWWARTLGTTYLFYLCPPVHPVTSPCPLIQSKPLNYAAKTTENHTDLCLKLSFDLAIGRSTRCREFFSWLATPYTTFCWAQFAHFVNMGCPPWSSFLVWAPPWAAAAWTKLSRNFGNIYSLLLLTPFHDSMMWIMEMLWPLIEIILTFF